MDIPITFAVEDELSDAVARKVVAGFGGKYHAGTTYRRGGFGYLKRTVGGFNNASKGAPWFVLTDLDDSPCPSEKIDEWLPNGRNHNLLLRVAVREVEAWLLADHRACSALLGIPADLIPVETEALSDPKETLLRLAQRSPHRSLRASLLPSPGSTARVGPAYNSELVRFVYQAWAPERAASRSNSLKRTINRLRTFRPAPHDR